jgi:hypothetical protein
MHALIVNGAVAKYPYTIGNLRKDNPQTSFPKRPTDSLLAEWGMEPVVKADRPAANHTKNVVESAPALVNGAWTQVWAVTDASAEDIAERTRQAANTVRFQRDNLLASTDWLVMDLMLWNVALTGVLALVSWFAKTMWAEQQRLNILLNRTREEVARDYVTKAEVHADINRVMQRLEQLDAKLDRLMERKG